MTASNAPVALVTGAALRIGAAITRALHDRGYRVIVHYRASTEAADALIHELNTKRPDSAAGMQADLTDNAAVEQLGREAPAVFGRMDLLVNNASSFYPTPLAGSTQEDWDALIGSNLRGAFFLSNALAPQIAQHSGSIINIVDTHADTALKNHAIYTIAKAGLKAMTKSLALELAPQVRVNGVSPGAILWPLSLEDDTNPKVLQVREKVLASIPLGHLGNEEQIAQAVCFLTMDATYMTGQVIAVDGGRRLT